MIVSLQEKLLTIPLYQLSFFTPLPKELVFYDIASEIIPEKWSTQKTPLTLQNKDEFKKINEYEKMLQLIQDPCLMGILLFCPNDIMIQDDILGLFQNCQFPIIKVDDPSSIYLFQQEVRSVFSYIPLSLELNGFIDKGFTQVASELSEALGTPFLYINENDQLLWHTGRESELQKANQWLTEHMNTLKRERNSNTYFTNRTVDTAFELYPVNIAGVIHQTLIASAELSDWQKRMIDKLVGLTALLLQTEEMFLEQQQRFKAHFIYDLLYHKFESKKVMVQQGRNWGWNLEKPHHLLVINVEVSNEMEMEWMDEVTLYLETKSSKNDAPFIIFPFQDQIVVLLEDGEDRTNSERKNYVLKNANQLEKILSCHWPEYQFYTGIGKWYQDATFLNKSYQEAKLAIQFGQYWFEYRNVYHIDDLGVLRLLIHIHQEILADYSQEYVSLLIVSDRDNGTEYIKTLKAFIQHQGIINEVSDALFIHPNTLRNRIKKIEDITGVNLQDPEEFMNLAIAVKLLSFFNH